MLPLEEATRWMQAALKLANKAAEEDEVPVGALVVMNGRIVGEGWNRTESLLDPTAHAEILALRRAAAVQGNYRLDGAVVVTTLEPCVMCLGACLESRVAGIVIGATDSRRGGLSAWRQGSWSGYPGREIWVQEGVEGEVCRQGLQSYFRTKRSSL